MERVVTVFFLLYSGGCKSLWSEPSFLESNLTARPKVQKAFASLSSILSHPRDTHLAVTPLLALICSSRHTSHSMTIEVIPRGVKP
nr:hypothetical protein CFP56_39619 [Quercus suber]